MTEQVNGLILDPGTGQAIETPPRVIEAVRRMSELLRDDYSYDLRSGASTWAVQDGEILGFISWQPKRDGLPALQLGWSNRNHAVHLRITWLQRAPAELRRRQPNSVAAAVGFCYLNGIPMEEVMAAQPKVVAAAAA